MVGTLPAALGNLDQLVKLQLLSNQLRGPIPASLGGLTNLQHLSFSNNHMSGSIPEELGSLAALQKLYLQGNQLSGPIPDLSKLTSLTHLYLNYNQLSGALPNSLGDLTNLQDTGSFNTNQLDRADPELAGQPCQPDGTCVFDKKIPTLSSLTSLEQLWLHNNDLTGGIPSWLGNLTRLTSLGLNTNQLDGTIPDLSRLVNLTVLSLRDNQLSGPIPAALGQLASLEHLYLSVNQLSGDFPAALGNLDDLRVTRFASNPLLTGCVPLGLRYLLTAPDFESTEFDPDRRPQNIPAQDFIAPAGWMRTETATPMTGGDSPGLNLPFCMVSGLTFSDVSLTPAFASATAAYTASVASTVAATTVTATLDADADSSDRVSISKGASSYASGAAVPLAAGPNEITITVTPTDGTPTLTYTVTIFREGEDQATLTALYNSTGGASWTDKTNWGSTEPLDEWFGVTADSNGNVTALELPGNNLSGTLPAALGSLTSLTMLDLSDNQLSGTIPT